MTKKTTQHNEINHKRNARRRKRRLEKHTGIDWIDPEGGYGVVRGEQALWRAVILQMLEDAASQSKKPQDMFDRDQARRWLEGNHKDFYMVCDLAGYDISYVKGQVKKALLNHCRWRKDAKKPAQQLPVIDKPINPCDVLNLNPYLKKSA